MTPKRLFSFQRARRWGRRRPTPADLGDVTRTSECLTAALAALGEVIDDTRGGVSRYLGSAPPAHREVPSDDRDENRERTEAGLRAADSHLAQALRFLAEAATEIDLAGQEVAHLPFKPTNDDLAAATAFLDQT